MKTWQGVFDRFGRFGSVVLGRFLVRLVRFPYKSYLLYMN